MCLSGESIANLIMDTLNKVELNLENLRVQEYDGVKGASTIIMNKYPKATYYTVYHTYYIYQ